MGRGGASPCLPRSRPPNRSTRVCQAKGDDDDEVRKLPHDFGETPHVWAWGEEAQAIRRETGSKARRWVEERTHSWLNRFRRSLIRWEKTQESALGFLHLVCAVVTYRAAGLLGLALT